MNDIDGCRTHRLTLTLKEYLKQKKKPQIVQNEIIQIKNNKDKVNKLKLFVKFDQSKMNKHRGGYLEKHLVNESKGLNIPNGQTITGWIR